ncbi:MAG TPA: hypothetical protein VMB49_08445 [Acidobacteriaceae bacterium]|nr:hypothetical protein [Acidobacteriaceae bacterium]
MDRLLWCFLFLWTAQLAHADGGPAFDLDGPRIQAKVTRAGKSLPIGSVANLAAGDRLWVHPDLPEKEGARYLLVIAFLRGSVNPPPENWFTKAETWNKKVREEGIYVTVPEGAEQVLLFLAPETGGDFSTLRNAVRGRPGAFVRAAQDLHQASLDRARLDTYLGAVKTVDSGDPKVIEDQTKLLARSLNIKVDQQCFDKPTEQQAPCLVQNPDSLVLDNGRSASVVQQVTGGAAGDMLAQMSYTQQAGSGYYSVYVGTVLDMAKILDSFHTAEYQYLPALAIPKGDTLSLKLNNPPSFHKPQSVLVVGLPAVRTPDLPVMHAVDPKDVLCAQAKPLVVQVVGAPYVFATGYAHDFVLRAQNKAGQTVDLPATPDAMKGGFLINGDTQKLAGATTGTLHGYWGFEPFEGPSFHLASAHPEQWTLASADQHALIVGRKDTVHLEAAEAACVDGVTAKDSSGKSLDAGWKEVKPNQIQIDLPLDGEQAGMVNLEVKQKGLEKPDQVPLHTYSEAAKLDSLTVYAGDHQGTLKGTRLDEVASMSINDAVFSPAAALTHNGSEDSLLLKGPDSSSFHPDEKVLAKVTLKDGRVLDLNASVQASRPVLKLLNKSIHSDGPASVVQLGSEDELPDNAKLTFAVQAPESFPRDQKIEIASPDNGFSTTLRVGDGGIVLQDSKTALVTLDPAKAFGGSAFGPLRFRAVTARGVAGDWQPLATLVRVPELKELKCVEGASSCTLVGSDLFLLQQVGIDAQLANAVTVPEGFGDGTLNIPRPNGTIYLKLRDDPAVVNTAVLPVTAEPAQAAAVAPPPAPAAAAAEAKPSQPGTAAPEATPSAATASATPNSSAPSNN